MEENNRAYDEWIEVPEFKGMPGVRELKLFRLNLAKSVDKHDAVDYLQQGSVQFFMLQNDSFWDTSIRLHGKGLCFSLHSFLDEYGLRKATSLIDLTLVRKRQIETKEDPSVCIVVLTNISKKEAGFQLLDIIDYHQKTYMVLNPIDINNEQAIIWELIDNGDASYCYCCADEDFTLSAVFAIFEERHRKDTICKK